ncbi:MAG: hypothetical protein A2268_12320 [Candidatus Raymondbacteria bacterium RifOxyA12_full_50_37]|uniref:DUF4340 domain-containing protein n=1 Tax=Candidatus Raymondbacteria bacterium RIFOXYD12_FULL_49_13 TaxID=1817890 RepID=A0A1F7F8D1_UNCRA|nr:MAG: hypothetical protein A2268_12320 [Candidatus Raymondbacteria bacterium RifOxyA12_full_50_37]OGJ91327.1 MAG: hypothetical protein A2248_03815 [Candidatus Raymondbacteria bacterium RIFOXYA2_FULL_49_16]OGJ97768.1 MAG: hypothetical protein A2453_13905 [Candidatus Raymondbacteria bacterium RIFOXYC2_FULL_50_21]OGK02920.1 MAG: hypothetical protein A2519_06215 [Candidatus Raymondbacteria bacterium RIFOXYD12_FULL_49_13]OGK05735.1 MAG: hypothetical protein A2487_21320 [Candidatus Raymondbacteria 
MRRTLLLLIVLVAAIGIIVVSEKAGGSRKNPPLFKGFDKAAVTSISIRELERDETVKKVKNIWVTVKPYEYPADTAKVREMLDLIADQVQGAPASKNPEKHKDLKVDTARGVRVIVEGTKNFTFYIGDMSPGYTGNYLRLEGNNNVYSSKGRMSSAFSTLPNFYRDKALYSLNKDNVNELTVSYREYVDRPAPPAKGKKDKPKEAQKDTVVHTITASFDVAAGKWKFTAPENAGGDASAINSWLAAFAGLNADDWYDDDTAAVTGFDRPDLAASFKNNDGTTIGLLVGAEKNGSRYVKVENSAVKFKVRSSRLTDLKRKFADLKEKPMPVDSGAAPQSTNMPGMN